MGRSDFSSKCGGSASVARGYRSSGDDQRHDGRKWFYRKELGGEANMLSGAMDMVKMQFGEGAKSDNKAIVDTEYSKLVASILSQFQGKSEAATRTQLRGKIKPAQQKLLDLFPKIELFLVRLVKSPRALPDIVTMISDRSRLMILLRLISLSSSFFVL